MAELEDLRAEVAELRAWKAAHGTCMPVTSGLGAPIPCAVGGAAGGGLPMFYSSTVGQPQTVVNVPVAANAGAVGGFLSTFTVNV